MALPEIVRGTYINLAIGDGEVSETFTPVCGITARNFTEQVNTNDTFVRDCADPEDVPVRRLVPTGKQWDLTGEGLFNLAQHTLIREATGVTVNWRMTIGRPTGSVVGAGYYEGPAMLTNRQLGGNDGGEFGSINLTLASDGAWEWTDAV